MKPGLEFRQLGTEGVLFDPETGYFYRVSAQASLCWQRLAQGEPVDLADDALLEFERLGLVNTGERVAAPETFGSHITQHPAFVAHTGCSSYTSQGKAACNADPLCKWTGSTSTGTCKPH